MGFNKNSMVGVIFTTGNSTVNQLPIGSLLQVVDKGRVQIVQVPQPQPTVADFDVNDRVMSKYGPATVVKLSSRFGNLEGFDPSKYVLYVADEEPITVRRALPTELEPINEDVW